MRIGTVPRRSDNPTPGDYAQLFREDQGRPDFNLLQTVLLRSLQQAVYSPDNEGGISGSGYDAYTHFTSPIRCHSDLVVHRAIKACLAGTRYQPAARDGTELGVCQLAYRAARGRGHPHVEELAQVLLHAGSRRRNIDGTISGVTHLVCSSRWTVSTSTAWCTLPSSATTTSISTPCITR